METTSPPRTDTDPWPYGVRSAIVFINGFGQGVGPSEGLQQMYRKASSCWYDRRRDLLLHRTWKSNHAEAADLIVSHEPELIVVVPYSYGAGHGLTQLAEQLSLRGRNIDLALLIDPVTRYHVLKPMSLGWLFRDRVTYQVPVNVDEVFSWRQVNHGSPFQPVGHRVKGWERTLVHDQVVLGSSLNLAKHAADTAVANRRVVFDVDHSNIDNHPTIHREVMEILTRRTPPPKEAFA